MKYLTFLVVISVLFVTGCTSPTQKVAVDATRRGLEATDRIHETLTDMVWQHSLNETWYEIKAAVESQDKDAAMASLKKFSEVANDVMYLKIQYERSRALMRVGLQYIYEQQGVVKLWWEDTKEAKSRSDAKDADEG